MNIPDKDFQRIQASAQRFLKVLRRWREQEKAWAMIYIGEKEGDENKTYREMEQATHELRRAADAVLAEAKREGLDL